VGCVASAITSCHTSVRDPLKSHPFTSNPQPPRLFTCLRRTCTSYCVEDHVQATEAVVDLLMNPSQAAPLPA
jgi:hypothetical protein